MCGIAAMFMLTTITGGHNLNLPIAHTCMVPNLKCFMSTWSNYRRKYLYVHTAVRAISNYCPLVVVHMLLLQKPVVVRHQREPFEHLCALGTCQVGFIMHSYKGCIYA